MLSFLHMECCGFFVASLNGYVSTKQYEPKKRFAFFFFKTKVCVSEWGSPRSLVSFQMPTTRGSLVHPSSRSRRRLCWRCRRTAFVHSRRRRGVPSWRFTKQEHKRGTPSKKTRGIWTLKSKIVGFRFRFASTHKPKGDLKIILEKLPNGVLEDGYLDPPS